MSYLATDKNETKSVATRVKYSEICLQPILSFRFHVFRFFGFSVLKIGSVRFCQFRSPILPSKFGLVI